MHKEQSPKRLKDASGVSEERENPIDDFYKLAIGGTEFLLQADFSCLLAAETATGCNIMKLLSHMSDVSLNEFNALLYGLLLKAQPQITPTDVAKLVSVGELGRLVMGVTKTLEVACKRDACGASGRSGMARLN